MPQDYEYVEQAGDVLDYRFAGKRLKFAFMPMPALLGVVIWLAPMAIFGGGIGWLSITLAGAYIYTLIKASGNGMNLRGYIRHLWVRYTTGGKWYVRSSANPPRRSWR